MNMSKGLPRSGYSIREVEIILGLYEKAGHRLVNAGKLKSFEGVDGTRRVSEEELYWFWRNNITNK